MHGTAMAELRNEENCLAMVPQRKGLRSKGKALQRYDAQRNGIALICDAMELHRMEQKRTATDVCGTEGIGIVKAWKRLEMSN